VMAYIWLCSRREKTSLI